MRQKPESPCKLHMYFFGTRRTDKLYHDEHHTLNAFVKIKKTQKEPKHKMCVFSELFGQLIQNDIQCAFNEHLAFFITAVW